MKLEYLVELFIDDVCAGKTNETPISYKRKLAMLVKYLGDVSPRHITPASLKCFRRDLFARDEKRLGSKVVKGHLSPWTVRSILVTVKHFCGWIHANGYVDCNPAHDFHIPQPPPPQPKAVSEQTVNALIRAASLVGEDWEQARNTALLYCLRDTGGRIGSLLNADVNGLDLCAGEIFTHSKSRPGVLYINAPTIRVLRAWLEFRKRRNPATHRVFISRAGRPLTRSGIGWIMKRLAEKAGKIEGRFNPHAFRHAFARDALKSHKADLSQVSRLMWHTSVRVTADYYARWDDAELKEVHRKASPGRTLPHR